MVEKREVKIMCGIIGYTGPLEAKDLLLNGLSGLEYRGYDLSLIHILQQDNPHLKDCLFHAILDGNIKGWPQALK